MSEADKEFIKLGFEIVHQDDNLDNFRKRTERTSTTIAFPKKTKTVIVAFGTRDSSLGKWQRSSFGEISMELMNAINYKLKELGWTNENNSINHSEGLLNTHGEYVCRFAKNHGITTSEAYEHPMVKAHYEYCEKNNLLNVNALRSAT